MEIIMHEIPVREIVKGFIDDPNFGCIGYGGKLNIRPAFQREFVYNDKQREEVITSILKDFPLNVMYWVRSGDDTFEMLDGQQRTISICQYVKGDFSLDYLSFGSLTNDKREKILNYKLMIYICEGNDDEKLSWFNIINIAGEKLTQQEARNAIYACEWLTDAKKFFSKNGCPAYTFYKDYLKGSAIRQNYLETALKWIIDRDNLSAVENYMDIQKNNNTPDASELWNYFKSVLDWVQEIFTKYRKVMKGIDWGILYNRHKDKAVNPKKLEEEISRLIMDDDVTNKSGIYAYVLDGNERHLNIRAFTHAMKNAAYERQMGICTKCGKHFDLDDMQADHITPWSLGGKTNADNCQMLCADCNRRKSNL